MAERNNIYIFLALLLVGLIVVVYLVLIKEKPVAWTPQNALYLDKAPVIKDFQEVESLIQAIDFSLNYLKKRDSSETVSFGNDQYLVTDIIRSLKDFRERLVEKGLTEDFFSYVRQNFLFYKGGADDVQVTGYYEAQLRGSLVKSEIYQYPLYRRPTDLVRINLSKFYLYSNNTYLPKILKGRLTIGKQILPYYSREEIDGKQKLAGKDLEMVWIDDPIDVFFLHIQGSGIVYLENGEKIRVNYSESNGHPYRAIGRLLIDRGTLTRENVSMQSIRQYLREHPQEMAEIFNYNPSYVFFREVGEGPLGFLGVPVTPFRSIATDRDLFPRGALGYIETELPVFDKNYEVKGWKKFSGFVLNQDTGGAIRTPGKVDLFTGHGKENESIAGYMKQEGRFYFLIKKQNPNGT